MSINKGIDFLLNHFDKDCLFPRTIMTKKLGKQKIVCSQTEALAYFKDSNFVDCRINAFPFFVGYKGLQRYAPDLIFIDLDKYHFRKMQELESVLSKTLRKISKIFVGAKSTVLWTGNGYHIYQPLESIVLEQYDIFAKFQEPSKQFLRFAKDYLSSGKADSSSNPSFKSCLLRLPYSINSKCIKPSETHNFADTDYSNISRVNIIQEWNGFRPSIKYILRDFLHYLINQKIKEKNKMIKNTSRKETNYVIYTENRERKIDWIEHLLKNPIADYRKHAISLILSSYLIKVKGLSYQESYLILTQWLWQCNRIRKLDFDANYQIKKSLNNALSKGIPPMNSETLKNRNIELYHKVTSLN